jgi:hypothetical protein
MSVLMAMVITKGLEEKFGYNLSKHTRRIQRAEDKTNLLRDTNAHVYLWLELRLH